MEDELVEESKPIVEGDASGEGVNLEVTNRHAEKECVEPQEVAGWLESPPPSPPQIDKSTDTDSSYKLKALQTALVNSGIENAKQKYSKVFHQLELNFFEKLFRIANIAQDGLLNDTELMFFLDHHDYVISKQEARQIIREGDQNRDGALDFAEFLSLCEKASINLEEIGILSEDWERQLQNSVKIRNFFRILFDSINIAPCIQETVEYFENKIAENADCKSVDNSEICLLQRNYMLTTTTEIMTPVSGEYDFDLIVLGNGAGGNSVAKEAAKIGKKVAICDSSPNNSAPNSSFFAPSCVNVGCVPKTLMNYAGVVGDTVDQRTSLPFGWFAAQEAGVSPNLEEQADKSLFTNDWSTLVDNIQSYIRTLNFERQFGLEHYKWVQYYNSSYEFDGPHTIKLTHEDKTTEFITGEKIVIAIGSTYRQLDIPGAQGNCITVDDIFSVRHHPGRVLIIGGGEDAIEIAGLLCGLKLEVTIMSRSPVLKGFDRRMTTLILETLHSRGVKIMIGWTPVEILCEERSGSHLKKKLTLCAKHVQTGERSNKDFDTIILAIGRKPATRLLNLKNAEVLIEDDTHKIWVDSQDMTTTEDVFALGDCASQRLSTPSTLINFNGVAYQAGLNLSKRLYHGHIDSMEYDQVLPRFLLTYPHSYACVGLSEEDAVIEHGETNIDVYHSRSIPLQYQLGNRYKTVCYAKMITLKSEDERIVGLHYLGPNAGDVMQGYVLALKLKARKVDMDSMINIHPTSAEIFSRMSKTFEESDLVLNSTC